MWADAKDILPPKLTVAGQYKDYIVSRGKNVFVAHWTSGNKFYKAFDGSSPIEVDAWMPLPDYYVPMNVNADGDIGCVIFNNNNLTDKIYHLFCPYCGDSDYHYNIVDGDILYCQECNKRFFVKKED